MVIMFHKPITNAEFVNGESLLLGDRDKVRCRRASGLCQPMGSWPCFVGASVQRRLIGYIAAAPTLSPSRWHHHSRTCLSARVFSPWGTSRRPRFSTTPGAVSNPEITSQKCKNAGNLAPTRSQKDIYWQRELKREGGLHWVSSARHLPFFCRPARLSAVAPWVLVLELRINVSR